MSEPYNNYRFVKKDTSSSSEGKIVESMDIETESYITPNPFRLQLNSGIDNSNYRSVCMWNGNTAINSYRHVIASQKFGTLLVQNINPTASDFVLDCSMGTPGSKQKLFTVQGGNGNTSFQRFQFFDSPTTTNPGYTYNTNDALGFRSVLGYDANNTRPDTVNGINQPFSYVMSNNTGNVLRVHSTGGTNNDNLFVITNGAISSTDSVAAQRLYIFHANGTADAWGTWISQGHDFSEVYEWYDGNPEGQDRNGYIVRFVEGTNKIELTQHKEDSIGVVKPIDSSGFTSNSGSIEWAGKYIRDEWGSTVKNHDGTNMTNPDYNPKEIYIPRTQRKEWANVGLVGLCTIRDNQEEYIPIHWKKLHKTGNDTTKYFVK